jgi:ADP-ribose pyrophosphatase YjhB (NUDIX family)
LEHHITVSSEHMTTLGVNIAIIQNGKILLTKREDFEVWCLPGGAVDEGESVAQAAIREAREETGLEVELTRLIGLYSHPNESAFIGHIISFAAQPIGGQYQPDPHEVVEMRYFAPDEIPGDLLVTHGRRIKDAFSGVGGGVVWSQDVDYPFSPDITRKEIYRQRDQSGLSRRDYYFATLGRNTSNDTLELKMEPPEGHR